MLRFVTLAPVILIVGFILEVAAPVIDDYYSARPVVRRLARFSGNKPVAVYQTRRELRYGLNFYRNHNIANYDDNEIPPAEHLLVGKAGSLPALSARLRGRRVLRIGGFQPQGLDYFLVSPRVNNREGAVVPSAQSATRTK